MQLLVRKVTKGRGKMEANVKALARFIFCLGKSKRGPECRITWILQIILAPAFFLVPGSFSHSWELTNALPQDKEEVSCTPTQNKITVRFMMHHSTQTHQHFCPKISIQAEFEGFVHLSRIYKCMNSYRAGASVQFMHPSPGNSWKKAQCRMHSHCFQLGSPRQVGGKPSYCAIEPLYFKCMLECINSP